MALGQYASLVGESGWRTQRLGRFILYYIADLFYFAFYWIELNTRNLSHLLYFWLYILIILAVVFYIYFDSSLALWTGGLACGSGLGAI